MAIVNLAFPNPMPWIGSGFVHVPEGVTVTQVTYSGGPATVLSFDPAAPMLMLAAPAPPDPPVTRPIQFLEDE